jgi:hypothetical protein
MIVLTPVAALAAPGNPLSAHQSVTVEHEGFGVIYESPTFSDRGLILYVDNNRCVAQYRIVRNEIVVGNGQLNVRTKEKQIPFGTAILRFECDLSNALVITRQ